MEGTAEDMSLLVGRAVAGLLAFELAGCKMADSEYRHSLVAADPVLEGQDLSLVGVCVLGGVRDAGRCEMMDETCRVVEEMALY